MDGTVLDVPSMDIVPSHYQHCLQVFDREHTAKHEREITPRVIAHYCEQYYTLNHYLNDQQIFKISGFGSIIIVSLKHILDTLLLLLNYLFISFETSLLQKTLFQPD